MKSIGVALDRVKTALRPPRLDNLFFLHIPKCGGTSLRHAMSEAYQKLEGGSDSSIVHLNAGAMRKASELFRESMCVDPTRLPEYLLLYHMSRSGTRFIDGHVPFSAIAHSGYHQHFRFVTILRDPVRRWISEYAYNKFHGGAHMRASAEMDLTDYMESEFGKGQGQQYVLYLGGRREDRDYGCPAAIEAALENTSKFDLIGCLEDIEGFTAAFHKRFGWPLQVKTRNASPSPPGFIDRVLSPDAVEQIAELCAPDYIIYNHVRSRIQSAIAN